MNKDAVILVVEDEDDSRETLRELLELYEYKVAVAATGAEALSRLDELEGKVCVMLLDLYMPVMDGWEVIERLRNDGRLATVKVVITTSSPHKAPHDLPVLTKPLDLERVLATVRSFDC